MLIYQLIFELRQWTWYSGLRKSLTAELICCEKCIFKMFCTISKSTSSIFIPLYQLNSILITMHKCFLNKILSYKKCIFLKKINNSVLLSIFIRNCNGLKMLKCQVKCQQYFPNADIVENYTN